MENVKMSKKEKAQFNQACADFHQKVKDDQKHYKDIIEQASRVIEIELSDGSREEKYEREFFEQERFGGGSFWRWEWFRSFYISKSDVDIVASEHRLNDAVCKEGEGKLPMDIEVNLWDMIDQILYRYADGDKRWKYNCDYDCRLLCLPKDWVFTSGEGVSLTAMTVDEFNTQLIAKYDNE